MSNHLDKLERREQSLIAKYELNQGRLSSDDAAAGSSEAPRSLEDKQDMLRKAREAFEKEKETQRSGGPLDRLGIDQSTASQTHSKEAEQPKKKGWW